MITRRLAALATVLAVVAGCTETDPHTGEARLDAGATAGAVAGIAALGPLPMRYLKLMMTKTTTRIPTIVIVTTASTAVIAYPVTNRLSIIRVAV